MELKTEVRRVGNSLGLLIPSKQAKKDGIAEGDGVMVRITPIPSKSRFFGAARNLPGGQSVKDEERKDWS
jgi:antitoxin component of MazEF toxin-antitoxin module